MQEDTVTTLKWWVDRVIGIMAAGALGLAGWSLTEIVALKIRTSTTEVEVKEVKRIQSNYQNELYTVEQTGTLN